jgi:bacterioferritin
VVLEHLRRPASRRVGELLGGRERYVLGRPVRPRPDALPQRFRDLGNVLDVGDEPEGRARRARGTLLRMASRTSPSQGILSSDRADEREELIGMLTKAYWMEIETVMSYIANSINPDGVRAQEIIESLEEDIEEELGHARQFGSRIKELYGVVPGSLDFAAEQSYLQPPEQQTDIVHVIKGVIEAESGAIEHYNKIIEFSEGRDPVTQDMVIDILRDEEGHRRLFEGFLREYEAEGLA